MKLQSDFISFLKTAHGRTIHACYKMCILIKYTTLLCNIFLCGQYFIEYSQNYVHLVQTNCTFND
jgi:hypothetical protein